MYKKTIILFIIFIAVNMENLLLAQVNDKFLHLLSPRGTETFYIGDELKIDWNYSSVSKINIDYLNKDNNWINLVTELNTENKKYTFIIPSDFPTITKIRIVDSNNSNYQDETQFFIRILPQPKIKINENQSVLGKVLANSSVLKIMPLGDSITEGIIVNSSAVRDGYRKRLKSLLDENGLNFDLVGTIQEGTFSDNQHEGHAGFTAKHHSGNPDLYDSLTTYLNTLSSFTPSQAPNIILLHIGTNDINDYRYSNESDIVNITVMDVSSNLDLIYNFDPTIRVILAKIINRIDETFYTPLLDESLITSQFNVALANMAANRSEFGTNLFLVDMESALSTLSDLSDGIHPNAIGYEKMSQVWFDGIKSILPKVYLNVFLEGAYSSPDMTSNLSLPNAQPFNSLPWLYLGEEYSDDIPTEAIDWVLVSLRTETTKASEVSCRAGFILSDGSIVDLDGTSPIAFAVDQGSYYVVVEHRNHLPIMSNNQVAINPE